MDKFWHWLVITALSIMALQLVWAELGYAQPAPQYGYVARPCGFDMDDDGRVGENGTQKFCQGGSRANEQCNTDGDCPSSTCATTGSATNQDCNVCDGNQGTGSYNTTDPDGDGVNEDFIYVDCNSGVDEAGCGEPDDSCKSINYALGLTNGTSFDSDGAGGTFPGTGEDIICVRAICASYNSSLTGSMALTEAGSSSGTPTHTETAVWPEKVSYEYANNPFLITAWDTDDDGVYPPYDTDQAEPFIIDGCANSGQFNTCTSAAINILFTLGSADRIGIGHTTIRNIGVVAPGSTSQTSRYVMSWSGSSTPSHHRIHDIELYGNMRNNRAYTDHRLFGFSLSGNQLGMQYITLENIYMDQNTGWHIRGWYGNTTDLGYLGTNFRAKNNTIRRQGSWVGVDGPTNIVPVRIWSNKNQEWIGNLFDHTGATVSTGVSALQPDGLMNDTYIVANKFLNTDQPILFKARGGSGDQAGGMDGAIVEANWIDWTENRNVSGVVGIYFGGSTTNGEERTECTSDGDSNACTPATTEACSYGTDGNDDCDCSLSPKYYKDMNAFNNFVDGRGNPYLRAGIIFKWGDNCDNLTDADTGPFKAYNNTVLFDPGTAYTDSSPRAAIMFGRSALYDWDFKYVEGPIDAFNNFVGGLANDVAFINHKRGSHNASVLAGGTYYTGTNFDANNNLYLAQSCSASSECDGGTCASGRCNIIFRQGTSTYSTLSAWQTATGEEAASLTATSSPSCVPTLEADGFHLASGSCAQDAGNNDSGNCPTLDFDGQTRDADCDIGADEIVAAAEPAGEIDWTPVAYTVSEATPSAAVTLTADRQGGSEGLAGATWATENGTATGGTTCTTGVDYITATDVLSWADENEDPITVSVDLCNDSLVEGNETFGVRLSGVSGATLGTASLATVTVTSEDSAAPPIVVGGPIAQACTDGTTLTIPNVAGDPSPGAPNSALIVAISATADYNVSVPEDPNCDMTLAGASVTWNAQSLTRMTSRIDNNDINQLYSECVALYALLDPADVISAVTVTFDDTVHQRHAASAVMYGVEQVVPPTPGFSSDGTISAPATHAQNVTVASANSLIADVIGLGNRVNGGDAIPGAGQVQLAEGTCGTTGNHFAWSVKGLAGYTGPSSMSWSWTTGTPERYAHAAAVWPPAPTPPTTVVTTTTSTTTTNTNTTTTTLPACGDGDIDVGEECDCVGACSAGELDNKKCSNFAPLAEGTLDCNADCTFDFSGCSRTTRGRVGVLRALGWCEASSEPACGGTCPVGFTCTDVGATCECQ